MVDSGLPLGTGQGQVTMTGADDDYTVTATSESGNVFTITKVGGGAPSRTCTTGGEGGCPTGGNW